MGRFGEDCGLTSHSPWHVLYGKPPRAIQKGPSGGFSYFEMLTRLAGEAKLPGLPGPIITVLEAQHARFDKTLDDARHDDLALLQERAELIDREKDWFLILNQGKMIRDVRDDGRQLLAGQIGLE